MAAVTLTLTEAAEIAGIAPATLRQAIAQQRLQATKRGRDWFVDEREIQRYIAERRPWYPSDSRTTTPEP